MSEEQQTLALPLTDLEKMEREGRWPDLSRLQERKPEALAFAVYLLGHRVPFREVSRVTGLHTNTLQMIADHPTFGAKLLAQKERVSATRRWAIELGTQNLLEQFRAGKADALAVKLLWDMEQVEAGAVTSRHEVLVRGEDDDYSRMVSAARQKVYDAEEIPTKGPAPLLTSEAADRDPSEAFIVPAKPRQHVDNERHDDN